MDIRPSLKLALIALAVVASGHGFAAVATASASCVVIDPIAVSKSADLSFGKFAAGAGGTLTVGTSGLRASGGVLPTADGGASTAAILVVSGGKGATFSVRHGGSTALSRTAGPDTMTLTTFSDLGGANESTGTATSGTLGAGTQSIYIGGTLNVAPNQAVGNYAGEVSVTVDYN